MSLGLLQMFTSLAFVTSMYGNTSYPVTYAVVDVVEGSLTLYLMIIIVFYGGQLIWKEHKSTVDR